jgi:hypothetical protein
MTGTVSVAPREFQTVKEPTIPVNLISHAHDTSPVLQPLFS